MVCPGRDSWCFAAPPLILEVSTASQSRSLSCDRYLLASLQGIRACGVSRRFKSEAFFCSSFNFGLDRPTDSLDLADSNQSTIGFDRFIEPLDSILGEILATSSVEGILLPFLSGINRSQRGHLNQAGGRSSHPQESVHSHRTLPHPMSHSPGCHSSMA